jgi:hypothetical protein
MRPSELIRIRGWSDSNQRVELFFAIGGGGYWYTYNKAEAANRAQPEEFPAVQLTHLSSQLMWDVTRCQGRVLWHFTLTPQNAMN